MSDAYLPGTSMHTIERAVCDMAQQYGVGTMMTPDVQSELKVPASEADLMLTNPDASQGLRRLLDAGPDDALVALPHGLGSDHTPQVLVRHCGPEKPNGTRDVLSTTRIVAAHPVGALAALGARLMFREPAQTLSFIGWRGLGLPETD